jgi:secreted protein with Ig-like and vWFA domain
MSTISHDDPRLTAYALGELPASERAAIEQQLANNPDLRVEVEQIRLLSGDLARDFAADLAQTPVLTKPQRATIARAAKPRAWRVVGWSVLTTAAAASIALLVLPATLQTSPDLPPSRLEMSRISASEVAPSATPTAPVPPPSTITAAPVILAKADNHSEPEGRFASRKPKEAQSASNKSEQGSSGAYLAIGPQKPAAPVAAPSIEINVATEADTAAPIHAEVNPAPASTGAFTAIGQSTPPFTTNPTAAPAGRSPAGAADAKSAPAAAKRSQNDEKTDFFARAPRSSSFRLDEDKSAPAQPATPPVTGGGETYNQRADHGFQPALDAPLSTFGLDVDTASYGNVRRMIEGGALPPRDAVRVEEMVNYFPYEDVPPPANGEAFGVVVEVAPCPWQPAHKLARVAIRGKALATRPALNLVFLVDVSGSMKPDNRLPLVKTGLSLLANSLQEHDQVTIVTYAGSAGVALPTTKGNDQRTILKAVDRLNADGGTNGGSGIQMAYDAARAGFVRGGVNRVILCTDGDFNVGVTNRDELVRMVQARATEGVFLTVLGVGQDNLKDATMELLADKANGHYHYLDTIAEARKVLVEQMSGTLVTIAKDAKAQVEFNPARIAAWRQLGYEKRQLAAEDFTNDRKDAGEIGADHQVTVLYELVPAELAAAAQAAEEDGLRYQPQRSPAAPVIAERHNELLTVKLRYKEPTGSVSKLVQGVVTDEQVRQAPSVDQRFAGAVAAFALRLRGTEYVHLDFAAIASEARRSLGNDPQGYRREFLQLVDRAARLSGSSTRE